MITRHVVRTKTWGFGHYRACIYEAVGWKVEGSHDIPEPKARAAPTRGPDNTDKFKACPVWCLHRCFLPWDAS